MSETSTASNGVNVEALLGARGAITENPDLAQFTWRATNTWKNGTHSVAEVENFYGLGAEQSHTRKFTFEGDHPLQFAAEDNGATPVETVLVALGGCLTAGVASIAQQRGIQLRSVKATIEGDHDIRGILGADPEVRNGFNEVRVNYEIDADASPEDLQALVAQSQKRSAVFDILTNPTAVTVNVS
ncbi:OsmC family protein [Nocardioides sp. zg-536]|uniref:OsmC family protein n=1 Tax=Nocardioides faecalis TaxID=2803858 RepID=A0A938Y1K0_9ACTN|nr:OsmC family protein [Nocardioides faecalis]MBM9460216.1 OsmC family protein [Nocardioides faecalis]MBS4754662.1 OsmC family protein [Nocardioides faecalis]QVI59993.1 OsmC family protein [Nocardioides faecalis]